MDSYRNSCVMCHISREGPEEVKCASVSSLPASTALQLNLEAAQHRASPPRRYRCYNTMLGSMPQLPLKATLVSLGWALRHGKDLDINDLVRNLLPFQYSSLATLSFSCFIHLTRIPKSSLLASLFPVWNCCYGSYKSRYPRRRCNHLLSSSLGVSCMGPQEAWCFPSVGMVVPDGPLMSLMVWRGIE